MGDGPTAASALRPTLIFALLSLSWVGCSRSSAVDDAQLDRWLEETHIANERAREEAGRDETPPWTLELLGEVDRPETLDWETLLSLESASFRGPTHADEEEAQLTQWRGVRLSALLDRAGVREDAETLTLVAYDGFRATVRVRDARQYPLILAYEADGEPLQRELGGPLYAVYPTLGHPELAEPYDARFWVFYVTQLVVGTADVSVQVGRTEVERATLDALPQTHFSADVGYRTGWPVGEVPLRGVRIEALLQATGATLPPSGRVRVLSLAPISRGDERPTWLSADEIRASDVMLATHWGDPLRPIPAALGGPVVLALPGELAEARPSHDWLTFVDELSVQGPPEDEP